MRRFYPDVCPGNNPCRVIVNNKADTGELVAYEHMCAFHTAMARTPADTFDVSIQSCRVREAARAALKTHMALGKEHPGLPYTVNADGSFTIQTGLPANQRAAARQAVNAATGAIRKPVGTTTVIVE